MNPANNKSKRISLTYRRYKLDELIIDKNHRLPCKKSFLALLALCDTIEPIKSFSQHENECILSKLSITTSEKTINITVLSNCVNFNTYFKSVVDLKNWLNVKVRRNVSNKSISIKILD